MSHPRILFVLKRRSFYGVSYGLKNSCSFLTNALRERSIDAHIVEVDDNNCIDKEVHAYKPTHVIIEALWVVPSKFRELLPLHRKIHWSVRLHSQMPFIAHEGIAVEWIREYIEIGKKYGNLHVSSNATEFIEQFKALDVNLDFLPNVYLPLPIEGSLPKCEEHLNIGCFGAIRPLKNHLVQAFAALHFAKKHDRILHFHVNCDRIEDKGDPVLKNLINVFKDTPHKLVHHKWMNHPEFIRLIRSMDIGMQVSLSETFNIVAADFVYCGIPFIGSKEIMWLSQESFVDFSHHSILAGLERVFYSHFRNRIVEQNKMTLAEYNGNALAQWAKYLKL